MEKRPRSGVSNRRYPNTKHPTSPAPNHWGVLLPPIEPRSRPEGCAHAPKAALTPRRPRSRPKDPKASHPSILHQRRSSRACHKRPTRARQSKRRDHRRRASHRRRARSPPPREITAAARDRRRRAAPQRPTSVREITAAARDRRRRAAAPGVRHRRCEAPLSPPGRPGHAQSRRRLAERNAAVEVTRPVLGGANRELESAVARRLRELDRRRQQDRLAERDLDGVRARERALERGE